GHVLLVAMCPPHGSPLSPYTTLFRSGLGGILGYYWAHTTSSESEAEQFAQDAKNMQPIPVAFEVTAPPNTPPDQPLYLSGSEPADRKSTRLNSSHVKISYAVFCLNKQ